MKDTVSTNSVTDPAIEPARGGGGMREDRLRVWEWLVLGLTLLLMLWVTIGFLPPGICLGDFGDFQIACQKLGIMHPPGYPGFVTLGFLATRIPGVEPAYAVSLMCLATGIASLALCIMIQVRLQVNMLLACASALLLLAHPYVWINLVAPEVYGLALLFVLAAVYFLVEYWRRGGRWLLVLAALFYGVAMANRPPVVFILPFVLIVWWIASRRWEVSPGRRVVSLATCAGVALVPLLYSFAFLLVRDQPTSAYNYVERHNVQMKILPDVSEGLSARMERAVWHGTAREFDNYLGDSAEGMRKKLTWLRQSVFDYAWDAMLWAIVPFWLVGLLVAHRRRKATWLVVGGVLGIGALALTAWYWAKGQLPNLPLIAIVDFPHFAAACLVLAGGIATARRCPATAWLLAGLIMASGVFVCVYTVHGQSADLLGLLVGSVIFASVAFSSLIARMGERAGTCCCLGFLIVMALVTRVDSPNRVDVAKRIDATDFLANLDMKSLPQDAVICTTWRYWPPLRYAQLALGDRSDIKVIFGDRQNWWWMRAGLEDRPILMTDRVREGTTRPLIPYRNMWRLGPATLDPAVH